VLPGAVLLGGTLMVLADASARWVVAPGELPISIMTSLLGAPFFLYLVYRNRTRWFL
jgi:iron complex transport system permease protein